MLAVNAIIQMGDPRHLGNMTYNRGTSVRDGVSSQPQCRFEPRLTMIRSRTRASCQSRTAISTPTGSNRTATGTIWPATVVGTRSSSTQPTRSDTTAWRYNLSIPRFSRRGGREHRCMDGGDSGPFDVDQRGHSESVSASQYGIASTFDGAPCISTRPSFIVNKL